MSFFLSTQNILLTSSQAVGLPQPKSPNYKSGAPVVSETYQQDGDFIKDIEINDLRNRYTLTKGPTQKRVIALLSSPLITCQGS